jgi:hypothetical protein
LTDSITAQVNSGNPDANAIASEIGTSVNNLVTTLNNTSGNTSSPADASSVSTPSTTETESVFPQSVTESTDQAQIATTTANDGGSTAATDFVTALSGNASETQISSFANLLREYVGSSNADADDLTVVGNFLNDVSAGNNPSGDNQVGSGSVFTQTSDSLTNVQSNIDTFTEILNQYSGLGSQGTESSDVAQLLQNITNFGTTIDQFQSGSGNLFASGDNSSNAI